MGYLTKSKFKLGLECMTKLYYAGNKNEYEDAKLEDKFLKALAEGGFQVGELAKFMFCENPVKEGITIESLDYEESLRETNERLNCNKKVVIAEAAFLYDNLFIRADIIVKDGDRIELYEVKSKSFEGEESDDESLNPAEKDPFLAYAGKKNECISAKWKPRLYDLAFQKFVVCGAMPEASVSAYLILVNKNAQATIDGMNQKFRLVRDGSRSRVIIEDGLTKNSLGDPILQPIPMDDYIEKIWNHYPVPSECKKNMKFEDFVFLCRDAYLNNTRYFIPLGSYCKKCQFKTIPGSNKKDGRYECWKHQTQYQDDLLEKPKVYELWGGRTDKFIKEKRFLLEQLNQRDFFIGRKRPVNSR